MKKYIIIPLIFLFVSSLFTFYKNPELDKIEGMDAYYSDVESYYDTYRNKIFISRSIVYSDDPILDHIYHHEKYHKMNRFSSVFFLRVILFFIIVNSITYFLVNFRKSYKSFLVAAIIPLWIILSINLVYVEECYADLYSANNSNTTEFDLQRIYYYDYRQTRLWDTHPSGIDRLYINKNKDVMNFKEFLRLKDLL